MRVVSAKHHFQSKSIDPKTRPQESSGFLSYGKPVFIGYNHLQPTSTDSKKASNHHYFFQMTSKPVFKTNHHFQIKINRSRTSSDHQDFSHLIRLLSLQNIIFNQNQPIQKHPQIIRISLKWPHKPVFKTNHHFQTESTDSKTPANHEDFFQMTSRGRYQDEPPFSNQN